VRPRPGRNRTAEPSLPLDRFEHAVGKSRRELERTIRAYHATVSSELQNGGVRGPREAKLETLARALSALASAVDRASGELDESDPVAPKLRVSGLELRELALDLLVHAKQEELPTVFDELEQNLISAASTILSSGRDQPQPA
jgi:hypothetical protein